MARRDDFTQQSGHGERFAILACLHPYLVDDTYRTLKDHLSAIGPGSGRGRPCQVPAISSMTSRLILQFGMLYDELYGGKTQEDLTKFAEKLLSVRFGHEVPHLFSLVLRVRKQAQMMLSQEVDNTKLLHFLDQKQDFSYPRNTVYCQKFSVTKGFLLGLSHSSAPPVVDGLPTGMLVELEHFRREQHLPASTLLVWLQELCPQLASVPTLTTKVRTLMKKHEKLIKDKTRYPEKLRQFKENVLMPTTLLKAAQKSTVSQQGGGHAEQQGFVSTTPVEAAQKSTASQQEVGHTEQQGFMSTTPMEAAQKSTVSKQGGGHTEQQGFVSTTPVEAAQKSTVSQQGGGHTEQQGFVSTTPVEATQKSTVSQQGDGHTEQQGFVSTTTVELEAAQTSTMSQQGGGHTEQQGFVSTTPVEAAQTSTVSQQGGYQTEQQGFMSTTPVEAAQTSTVLHQEGGCAEQQLDDGQKRVSSESSETAVPCSTCSSLRLQLGALERKLAETQAALLHAQRSAVKRKHNGLC